MSQLDPDLKVISDLLSDDDRVIQVQQLRSLAAILIRLESIMADLNDLTTAVAAEHTVVASAVTLLEGIAARIAALEVSQTAINALAADVTSQTTDLAAAVANVPAA